MEIFQFGKLLSYALRQRIGEYTIGKQSIHIVVYVPQYESLITSTSNEFLIEAFQMLIPY